MMGTLPDWLKDHPPVFLKPEHMRYVDDVFYDS